MLRLSYFVSGLNAWPCVPRSALVAKMKFLSIVVRVVSCVILFWTVYRFFNECCTLRTGGFMFVCQRIVLFLFFFCGFVRAASVDAVAQEDFDRKWLNGRGHVRLLCLSQTKDGSGKRYSVTYDLTGMTYCMRYRECGGSERLCGIQSVFDCVRDSFLKGSVLKKGCEHPKLNGGMISWGDIPWEDYRAKKFGSKFLEKTFLTILLSGVETKAGWLSFDESECWDMPKKSLVQACIPRGKSVYWQIVSHEDLEQECARKERSEAVFFLIAQDFGVLRGGFRYLPFYGVNPESLLECHLSDNEYVQAFLKNCPYTSDRYVECINYKPSKSCGCVF